MIRQFAIDINVLENSEAQTEQMIYVATAINFIIINAACLNCGSRATQKPHSRYTRWLLTWEGGKKIEKRVDVTRTICCACEGTHAIVPDTVIPHMQYSLLFVLGVMWEYTNRQRINKTVAGICAEREISPTTLRGFRALIVLFWIHLLVANPKNVSKGYDPAHPQAEYLRNKSWYLEYPVSDEQIADTAGFVKQAAWLFRLMKPFNDYLNAALKDFRIPTR